MSHVSIQSMTMHFDGKPPTKAVDDLDLEIEEGEFLVLLGPSGCGKTTTLRCLAGLETPSAGQISFGPTTVFDAERRVNLSPDKRNIGMVFQSYALWPHMTVRKNINYPLKARRIKEGLKGGWVEETAALVDCGTLLDRYPAQLSGGQQQRVALARGLVARPDLVCSTNRSATSTPVSATRCGPRSTSSTVASASRPCSSPTTSPRRSPSVTGWPSCATDASSSTTPPNTSSSVRRPSTSRRSSACPTGSSASGPTTAGRVTVRSSQARPLQAAPLGGTVAVRLRSEDVDIHPSTAIVPADRTTATATIVDSEYGGKTMDVVARLGDTRIFARIPSGDSGGFARRLTPGERVTISFRPTDAMLYEAEADRSADAEAVGEQPTDVPAHAVGV